MRRIQASKRSAAIAALAAAAVVIGTCAFVVNSGDGTEPVVAAPLPTPAPLTCSSAPKPFVPTSVSIPGVDTDIRVLPLARDGVLPGTPPLTTAGKASMAFDLGQHVLVGASKGNALLNAHTYPDGSALGNKLLKSLEEGDQINVRGLLGKTCYRVTERIEVPAGVYKRYFDKKGVPQIAIVVCSGERIGPGNWTKRTLWFAAPMA